ncbi:hypothetical protein SO802_004779 [Lithocarpus litseifolius]|uniref:Uncharacterized protein n=1 Tax=Lithocarpus litseifolius TaxID=425828 RepID=A0AAW2DGW0_9ROSI
MALLLPTWRVGNGALIRIYHDSWLPDPYNKRVVSPRVFLAKDAQVSVLIDKEHRCWLLEAIDNIFLPHEAAAIKSIPLSLKECEDKMFWPHSPDGKYSVRSAYKLLMEEALKESPSPSDLTPTKRIWKGIWSLRVPNRVKTLNHLRVGDSSAPLWKIHSMALDSLQEFQRATSALPPAPKAPIISRWLPPLAG